MGYYASYSGSLTPRDGKTKEEIEEALEMFEDYYENKDGAGVLFYEVSGDSKYYEEDYDDLSKIFDGEVDFSGEDDARWTLFLKDGQVKETSPIEITTLPDEDITQSIARYIGENNIDLNLVVKAVSEIKTHEQKTDQGSSQEQEDELELS